MVWELVVALMWKRMQDQRLLEAWLALQIVTGHEKWTPALVPPVW